MKHFSPHTGRSRSVPHPAGGHRVAGGVPQERARGAAARGQLGEDAQPGGTCGGWPAAGGRRGCACGEACWALGDGRMVLVLQAVGAGLPLLACSPANTPVFHLLSIGAGTCESLHATLPHPVPTARPSTTARRAGGRPGRTRRGRRSWRPSTSTGWRSTTRRGGRPTRAMQPASCWRCAGTTSSPSALCGRYAWPGLMWASSVSDVGLLCCLPTGWEEPMEVQGCCW